MVTFVSGHLFFTRTVALPEGMRPTDVHAFAELTLEEMSPFSLEHLAWGYVIEPGNRWLLIMAACRPRISPQELEEWGPALFVLPGFYSLLTGAEALGGARAVLQGNCLTLAHYEEGCPLPVSFTHQVIETEGDVEAEALARYAAERPTEARESGLLVLRQAWEERDGSVVFEHARLQEGETPGAPPDDAEGSEQGGEESEAGGEALIPVCIENVDTLWLSDLREPGFKNAEQRARRLSAGLWKSMLAAGALAALLVIGACVWILLAGMQSSRIARIERQAPEVAALDLKDQNLRDLKQFAGSPFRPFDILNDLNEVIRGKMANSGVYFDSVALSKDNEVTVRGKAGNIVEVNRYADALKASGLFEEISPPDYQSRGSGEARFTLELRYLPPPEAAQASEPEATDQQPQTVEAPQAETEPKPEESA